MDNHSLARRAMLKSIAMGTAAVLALGRIPAAAAAAAAALVPLTDADPTAKALGYVDDSSKVVAAQNPTHKPEQKCSNCLQFKGKAGDARGGCNLYPGKSVAANGWCRGYAKKPTAG
ncbi:MAG TPA: high-potential iron-sulfur protein [Steroidobacteraceae bacterium]|nr:high-potential iron-sulfur protein [Steroidobacteraceae bacterium]